MDLHVIVQEFDEDVVNLTQRSPPGIVVTDLRQVDEIGEEWWELRLIEMLINDILVRGTELIDFELDERVEVVLPYLEHILSYWRLYGGM